MKRIACVLSVVSIIGCEPNSGSRPPTIQDGTVLARSDSDAVTDVIDLPGLPTTLLTADKGKIGVAVFQANTGEPYLRLGDTDGDGVFDMLEYYSLSASGETLAVVEDYGMDGQPDFILNFEGNTGSVYYSGSWREVQNIGPNRESATVEIDGQYRLLNEVLTEIGRRPF